MHRYSCPNKRREEMNKQINECFNLGVIRPCILYYNPPILIVIEKADANRNPKWRLVVYHRKLNKVSVPDTYPRPIIDGITETKYYTVIESASGFSQIPINESDIHQTAFECGIRCYDFRRIRVRLINELQTKDVALAGLLRENWFVYMDNIVFHKTFG